MTLHDLAAIAALTAFSCLAVFLLIVLLRLIPAVRRSTLVRRLALTCAFTGFGLLALLALIAFLLESDASARLRAIPSLILAIAALTLFLYGRYAWRLRREPLRGPACPHCRYNLTGITPLTTCPECGRALTNQKKLYRPNIRRWATRSAVLVLLLAIVWPPYDIARKHGWPAIVPDRLLFQLLVWNIEPQAVVLETYRRDASLEHYPALTRDLMRSYADEYDRGTNNYNRLYPLYRASNTPETNELILAWLTSPSKGERFVAASMLATHNFSRLDYTLNRTRPLLKDPDNGVRTAAFRAMVIGRAMPIEELLALAADPKSGILPTEITNALSTYPGETALQAQIDIAANPGNGWGGWTTWGLIGRAGPDYHPLLKRLAAANAAFPKPNMMPGYDPPDPSPFKSIFTPIIDAALDPADPVTAAWSRACLLSLCAPGQSLTPPRPIILQIIDGKLANTKDPATRAALLNLRTTIDPTTPQSP